MSTTISTAIPLMEHQVVGAQYALTNRRVLIGDEMGVGKTPTAVAIAASEVRAGRAPVLVIVPPSMRLQWVREFARFTPDITTATLTGRSPVKDRRSSWRAPDADVLIIGDLSLDGYLKYLRGKIAGIIIDECQRIKGGKRVKRSQAAVDLAHSIPESGVRVVMSGTPLINHPLELLPSLRVIDRVDDFGDNDTGLNGYAYYMARFAPRIDSYGTRGVANLDELHERLKCGFMIRRKRAEVLTLPNKGRITTIVEMSATSTSAYRAAQRDLLAFVEKVKGKPASERAARAEALVLLNTLRAITGDGKVDAVVQYAENLLDEDEQVFITTTHATVLDALAVRLGKRVRVARVEGGMSDAAKMRAVDSFQSGESRVLVGNVTAAGVGLTLTAGRHHISAELPWTSADLMQCEDRLSRFGQTREVVSHILLAGDVDGEPSVDSRMFGLIDAKLATLSQVLDGTTERLVTEDTESVALGVLRTYGWTVEGTKAQ